MAVYGDVKSKTVIKALKHFVNKCTDLELLRGGKHNLKLHCIHNGKKFPVPCSHRTINRYIVKDIEKFLVDNGITTPEEFRSRVK